MPRYFFHTEDGEQYHDDEGVELTGLPAARMAAVTLAGELLRDRPEQLWQTNHWRMWVTDEKDHRLFEINVSAAQMTATVHQLRRM